MLEAPAQGSVPLSSESRPKKTGAADYFGSKNLQERIQQYMAASGNLYVHDFMVRYAQESLSRHGSADAKDADTES
jgi:hypothetical protein